MANKRCTRCEIEKALTAFPRRTASRDGRDGRCKMCASKQNKEYRDRPEVKKAKQDYHKKYYARPENKERQKEYMREYMRSYYTRPAAKAKRKECQKKYHARLKAKEARGSWLYFPNKLRGILLNVVKHRLPDTRSVNETFNVGQETRYLIPNSLEIF